MFSMLNKIQIIVVFLLYLPNSNAEFIKLSSDYCLTFEWIFSTECPQINHTSENKCHLTLTDNDTVLYKCLGLNLEETTHPSPNFGGSFQLSSEATELFYCLAKNQSLANFVLNEECKLTIEYYKKEFPKQFVPGTVNELSLVTNRNMNSGKNVEGFYYTSLTKKLLNLKELNWYLIEGCPPLNSFLRGLKQVERISIFVDNIADFVRCEEFTFENVNQLKELKIENLKYYDHIEEFAPKINKSFLKNLKNLQVLKWKGLHFRTEFELPIEILKDLVSLREIEFIDCHMKFMPDYFQNLNTLRSLRLQDVKMEVVDWISYESIGERSFHLEIDNSKSKWELMFTKHGLKCPSHCTCIFNRLLWILDTDCRALNLSGSSVKFNRKDSKIMPINKSPGSLTELKHLQIDNMNLVVPNVKPETNSNILALGSILILVIFIIYLASERSKIQNDSSNNIEMNPIEADKQHRDVEDFKDTSSVI